MKYKRILLKLSGEQLAGKYENGIDAELAAWFAKEVKKVAESGTQVVIMVGGGNFVGVVFRNHVDVCGICCRFGMANF